MEKNNKEKNNKTLAMPVTSLVLGIISVVMATIYYISIPASILAIIFGVKSKKKDGSKLGTAGLILGIVGISICVFIYGLFISMYVIYG